MKRVIDDHNKKKINQLDENGGHTLIHVEVNKSDEGDIIVCIAIVFGRLQDFLFVCFFN